MKKIIFIAASTLFLTACTEKQDYTDRVLEVMKQDRDVADYKIDPEMITDCIVDLSTSNMPGLFPLDPARLMSYKHYTKMLSMDTVADTDKKRIFDELRADFGSPKALAAAHTNYTESMMNCMGSVLMKSEDVEKEKGKEGEGTDVTKVEAPAES